jgi:hypothetical protein
LADPLLGRKRGSGAGTLWASGKGGSEDAGSLDLCAGHRLRLGLLPCRSPAEGAPAPLSQQFLQPGNSFFQALNPVAITHQASAPSAACLAIPGCTST